ncbi:MAG: hypothetical protein Kow0069_11860 [Promethearchaeota archaeon]
MDPNQVDLHVHTEGTSPYKKGDANLAPYHAAGARHGLKLLAITDHYHYVTQPVRYVLRQRRWIDDFSRGKSATEPPRMLLGVEQTIFRGGRLDLRRATKRALDLVVLSVHWFGVGTPGFVGGTRLGRQHVERLGQWLSSGHERGARFLRHLERARVGALLNRKVRDLPRVLGHPWSNLLSRGLFFPALLESAGRVLEVAGREGAAFELNDGSCRQLLDAIEADGPGAFPGTLPAARFVEDLFGLLVDHDVPLSVGSDAHVLSDVGRVGSAVELLCWAGQRVPRAGRLRVVGDGFLSPRTRAQL